MRNKKGYQIIQPTTNNEERFGNYYCYYLFWVAVGYYLWKKILTITGYRFHPTDVELLHYYLHNKNLGRDALVQAITEVEDICGIEPWELPSHSNIHSGDQVWYFFYRPNYKYRNSTRMKRTTNEGYWKPTGNPRKVMARDLETEIGKKRTLVFYKGRVGDNIKNKTGWIMHEYELTATLPKQPTFILCKLKKKYGKDEVPCIDEGQSSRSLPPNLGNYIADNEIPAEAARNLTEQSDPNELLTQLQVFNAQEGLELLGCQSTESWNSYLVDDFPEDESTSLPFNCGIHNPKIAIPNDQLNSSDQVPMEQEVPRDQPGTNEQLIEFGNSVPANDERGNQHNSLLQNDGSTACNLKSPVAEDSVYTGLSDLQDGELFAELGALREANCLEETFDTFKGNVIDQDYHDWITFDMCRPPEIPKASGNQSGNNEEQNAAAANVAGIVESSEPINYPSRKRSRPDEGSGLDM